MTPTQSSALIAYVNAAMDLAVARAHTVARGSPLWKDWGGLPEQAAFKAAEVTLLKALEDPVAAASPVSPTHTVAVRPELPDDIESAINRAAEQVKRRADAAHSRHPDDRTLSDHREDYAEDITDELAAPIRELAAKRADLRAALFNVRSMVLNSTPKEIFRAINAALVADEA
jgi:hypothetical protein